MCLFANFRCSGLRSVIVFGAVFAVVCWSSLGLFAQQPSGGSGPQLNFASVSTDTMPSFPGGDAALTKYLREQVVFPEAAKGKGIQGTVMVTFVVNDEGQMMSPSVLRSLDPDIDAEALRVVKAMPRWNSAILGGKPVSRLVTLPIEFRNGQEEEKPVTKADVMPEFPKGTKGLQKFLNETLWYPDEARSKLIEGVVIVSFIVEKDGSATHPAVLRSLHPACDTEALRVIRMMPKWTPGTIGGKPVRVQMNLSMRFSVL